MARTGPKQRIQSIETIPDMRITDMRKTLAIPTAEELRALYDASPEEMETEEPDAGERAMDLHGGPVDVAVVDEMVRAQAYSDESSKLYIGRVFKPLEFAAWYAAQRLGSLPFNGVSVHHTYIPDQDDFNGVSTIHGVFNYYANTLKWPRGRGPHFWLYGGDGRYGTQSLIGVGTHPAHDGIAVSYRNHRWAGIEAFGYYDSRAMPQSMIDLYRFTLQTICGSRIPIKNAGAGVDGPKSPIGQIFHRNAPNAGKSCPGNQVKESWFFPAMQKKTPAPPKPTPPEPPTTGPNYRTVVDSTKDPKQADKNKALAVSRGYKDAWTLKSS